MIRQRINDGDWSIAHTFIAYVPGSEFLVVQPSIKHGRSLLTRHKEPINRAPSLYLARVQCMFSLFDFDVSQ